MNKRSAFIVTPEFTAFVDGIPCDHECNSNGDPVYRTASGKYLYWHTHREWAHLTSEARYELLEKHYREIGDPICMGTATCSICKEWSINQTMWL